MRVIDLKAIPHVNDRRLNDIICQNPFSFSQLILFVKHLLSQALGSRIQWCWVRLNTILVSYYLLNFRWTSLEKWSMWMLSSRNYFHKWSTPRTYILKYRKFTMELWAYSIQNLSNWSQIFEETVCPFARRVCTLKHNTLVVLR